MYYKGKIYSGEPWTAEENQKLKEMAKAQKPFYEIAESFKPKRTINAVFFTCSRNIPIRQWCEVVR